MSIVKLVSKGDFHKTTSFLNKIKDTNFITRVLEDCGQIGVQALADNTPANTGLTASSWYYEVENTGKTATIYWCNSNLASGYFPVAIMLQYGHGTGTGGYVQGVDYINPAIKPVFDNIADTVWKVVQES